MKLFGSQTGRVPVKMMSVENFLRLSPKLASGGSPTLPELEELRNAGCEVVINLALPTSINAIPVEGDHVRRMGMHLKTAYASSRCQN